MSQLSPGTVLLGIVAVLFGLLGAFIVRQRQAPPPELAETPPPAAEYVSVPMTSTDLKSGREITLGDIAVHRLTRSQMKKRGIERAFMNNTQQIIGRVLRQDLTQGEIFETSLFYPEGTGPSVAELLEAGQRAITIPVQLDAAVAGFATPGTWVDVLFRSDANPDKEQPETTVTLLEKVRVLALDQKTFSGARQLDSLSSRTATTHVTLAVNPGDVSALGVVGGRGLLSLALRNPDDETMIDGQFPRTLDELLNIPPPNRHKMEIFRGGQLSSVQFNDGNRLPNSVADRRATNNSIIPSTTQPASATLPPETEDN